jgi:hypothetical protein
MREVRIIRRTNAFYYAVVDALSKAKATTVPVRTAVLIDTLVTIEVEWRQSDNAGERAFE